MRQQYEQYTRENGYWTPLKPHMLPNIKLEINKTGEEYAELVDRIQEEGKVKALTRLQALVRFSASDF
jgi:hypothetical protein